jgi:hypothetical protein
MTPLAQTYTELGRLTKAEGLVAVVLQKQRKLLGEDQPETLWSMGQLARIFYNLGQILRESSGLRASSSGGSFWVKIT